MRRAAVERYRTQGVRYLPLGSPWSPLKCVYGGLVRAVLGAVQVGTGRVVYRAYYSLGSTGWVLPLPTHPLPTHSPHIGIARAQPIASPRYLRPLGHSRAPAGPLRTPQLLALSIRLSGPIKARFHQIYPKVSSISGVSTK